MNGIVGMKPSTDNSSGVRLIGKFREPVEILVDTVRSLAEANHIQL